MKNLLRLLLLPLVALAAGSSASAQFGEQHAHGKLHVHADGDLVLAAIPIEIDFGWHLYHDDLGPDDAVGMPTTVAMEGDGIEWSAPVFPAPHRYEQPDIGRGGRDTWIQGHEDALTIWVAGRMSSGADPSSIAANVDGLTCEDGGQCVPYGERLTPSDAPSTDFFAAAPAALTAAPAADVGPRPTGEIDGWGGPTGGRARAVLFAHEADGVVDAVIEVKIDRGWHLYHDDLGPEDAVAMPTEVTLGGEGISWSDVVFPTPDRIEQPGIGAGGNDTWVHGHHGTIRLFARGRLWPGAEVASARALLSGLTCEEQGTCIPYSDSIAWAGVGRPEAYEGFPTELSAPAVGGSATPVAPAASEAGPVGERPSGVIEGWGESTGGFGSENHANAKLYVRHEGSDVRAAIEVDIDFGWHLYHEDLGFDDAIGIPTSVQLGGAGLSWSDVRFPEPHTYPQTVGRTGQPTSILGHEGTIVLYARGYLWEGATIEDAIAKIDGLTCEEQCIPYSDSIAYAGEGEDALFAEFPEDLEVAMGSGGSRSAAAGGTDAGATTPVTESAGAASYDYASVTFDEFGARETGEERSILVWLLLAFVAGVILNVMPCVLPVISIKILSFVQQAGEDRKRIFLLGLSFSAGIIVVFLALAGVAISLGIGWGEQFQSETFKVVMIGVVFAFALSLFGVYELGVPKAVGSMAGAPQREGLGDAFFKGMLATVLATPCSGPFLGSTLTWTLSQSETTIFLVFLTLGVGMAFPYVLLTANPKFLKFMPKPGAWMETFKQAMGFVLLVTAVYLMRSVESNSYFYLATFLTFVALGCWWWGRFATFDQTTLKRLGTLAAALVIAVGGYWFAFVQMRGWLEAEDHDWIPFEPDAFYAHIEAGNNVFVDFTADWCPNCKTNEALVYHSEEIEERFGELDVVPMIADITHASEYTTMVRRLMGQLGAKTIPFAAMFPGDDPYQPYTLFDIVTTGELNGVLDELTPSRTPQLAMGRSEASGHAE